MDRVEKHLYKRSRGVAQELARDDEAVAEDKEIVEEAEDEDEDNGIGLLGGLDDDGISALQLTEARGRPRVAENNEPIRLEARKKKAGGWTKDTKPLVENAGSEGAVVLGKRKLGEV